MTRQKLCCSLESLIRWDVLFLLVATPLAFGTVHVWAFSAMEVIVFSLMAFWMITRLLQPRSSFDPRIPATILWPMGLFVAVSMKGTDGKR